MNPKKNIARSPDGGDTLMAGKGTDALDVSTSSVEGMPVVGKGSHVSDTSTSSFDAEARPIDGDTRRADGGKSPKVLLVTPPLLQPNTPYAAMPALAGFVKSQGIHVVQTDLSLALVLELLSEKGVDLAVRAARRMRRPSPEARFLLDNEDSYRRWIGPAVAFLQGRRPELAWRLARPGELPEGPHFRELATDDDNSGAWTPGDEGIVDRARMAASLFLDDVADLLRALVDADFGFSRYAEHLAVAAPTFDPILRRLRSRRPSEIDRRIDRLAREAVERERPDIVGVTAPFPGTVYGAFRVAAAVKDAAPGVVTVLGGGYVNSELRDMDDPRVFEFFDRVCYDEGYAPWLGVLGLGPEVRTKRRTKDEGRREKAQKAPPSLPTCVASSLQERVPIVPDYAGLDLSQYVSLVETANPMSRLWSDGRWLKLQLANGCYWHRCAFCDVALDYIGGYRPADPARVVDSMQEMRRQTGLTGFHFTDEAIPPALARGVSDELLRRGETVSWWGNVRLDRAFDAALAARMADSGCIAVTAGLECANDRLLKLMNKGITLASARRACRAFAEAGILVHVYLMYGFPTETEAETLGALETLRDLFAEGLVQSAFWHRFALTVHSPIAHNPARFGIEPLPPPPAPPGRRFALNEIPYREPGAPDLDRLGHGLALATYNYMRGQGLDLPVGFWFREKIDSP